MLTTMDTISTTGTRYCTK